MSRRMAQVFSLSEEVAQRLQFWLKRLEADSDLASQLGLLTQVPLRTRRKVLEPLPPVKFDEYGLTTEDYTKIRSTAGLAANDKRTGRALISAAMLPPIDKAVSRKVQTYITQAQRRNRKQAAAVERNRVKTAAYAAAPSTRQVSLVNTSRIVELLLQEGDAALEKRIATAIAGRRTRGNGSKAA